jgi:hypothetical protein
MNATTQERIALTAHPLQRIGAYALTCLAGAWRPDEVEPRAFQRVVEEMTGHALRAGLTRDTKQPDGFWLKCSLSLFPNSPMNHPSNGKKDDQTIQDAVHAWRRVPTADAWPPVTCVLCGRAAVRYFGKVDVPLAESDSYRNTTPRGHDGMALCWPCACSFYALPYGCRLTGGPAIALHSWDDGFLLRTVSLQVQQNRQLIAIGQSDNRQLAAREVLALWALRHYENRMTAGVELLVFSNNNRGQTFELYSMDQAVAEWLRTTIHARPGFVALLRAHRVGDRPGAVGLARNAFRDPARIVSTCGRYLAESAAAGEVRADTAQLVALCFSYVDKVMRMDKQNLDEISATAQRVGSLLSEQTSAGPLKEFYSAFQKSSRLRAWLRRRAVDWALSSRAEATTPLLTTRGFGLLFDPDTDNQAWFSRELFLIGVLEELHRREWRPVDGLRVAQEIQEEADDLHEEDRTLTNGEEEH